MISREEIVSLLATNDRAVMRALVVLNSRQTSTEQSVESTVEQNGRGFRPCHAHMGTSMAKFYTRNGYLSQKQIAYWRAPDRNGSMRIGIYWRQLQEEAIAKAAAAKKVISAKQAEDAEARQAEHEVKVMQETEFSRLVYA